MRIIIFLLVAVVVAGGLLLFDDVDTGLSIINIVVWGMVALVGLVLLLRNRFGRKGRRRRRSRRDAQPLIARNDTERLSGTGADVRRITHR